MKLPPAIEKLAFEWVIAKLDGNRARAAEVMPALLEQGHLSWDGSRFSIDGTSPALIRLVPEFIDRPELQRRMRAGDRDATDILIRHDMRQQNRRPIPELSHRGRLTRKDAQAKLDQYLATKPTQDAEYWGTVRGLLGAAVGEE